VRSPGQLPAGAGGELPAGTLVGVALEHEHVVLLHDGDAPGWRVPLGQAPAAMSRLDTSAGLRWVWWSAGTVVPQLLRIDPSLRLARCWDLAAVHRLLHGGSRDHPSEIWCAAYGLDIHSAPRSGQLDLLGLDGDTPSAGLADDDGSPQEPVRPDGYLRPDWLAGGWRSSPVRARHWAALALEVARRQLSALSAVPSRGDPLHCARAESAAELFSVELAAEGLPVDRAVAEDTIASIVGRRPLDEADEKVLRSARDRVVLDTVPTAGSVDLRSPAQVKELLGRTGFDLPDTRSWRLEPLAGTHPLIGALLAWRRAERVASTYGYRWLDQHLAADGRLRGAWSGSDGGAGRMTAQAGLHSMPRELRTAVRAAPGHLLVRADLGQVEPRVLAAISGDHGLARAARADDLYADVAAALRCERPVAKIAVLAAMYGQTSGAAGEALRDMERTYPAAIRFLQEAALEGKAGRDVLTYGGRRVRMWHLDPLSPTADETAAGSHEAALAARGRFARNAVVQGSAAELFKAWTATVRARLAAERSGSLVLCLHDELLLHVREDAAEQVGRDVVTDLEATATRWSSSGVRFVADVAVVERWSQAKG